MREVVEDSERWNTDCLYCDTGKLFKESYENPNKPRVVVEVTLCDNPKCRQKYSSSTYIRDKKKPGRKRNPAAGQGRLAKNMARLEQAAQAMASHNAELDAERESARLAVEQWRLEHPEDAARQDRIANTVARGEGISAEDLEYIETCERAPIL
jgi:hypothetical protein